MEELLALLERYSPGYRRLIQRAYDWRIDELEQVFGQPLPAFYREFASVMGAEGGPLLAHVDTYEPTEISELYELSSMDMPPRRFLFVFGDTSLDSAHYWLDLETRSEEGDCQVVQMPFGADAWKKSLVRRYISLREMLFVWAMEHIRFPALPHLAKYFVNLTHATSGHPSEVEELAQIFEKLGFHRLLYPRHCLLFDREDAGIELIRSPDESDLWFWLSVREHKEFRRLRAIIEDISGVERA